MYGLHELLVMNEKAEKKAKIEKIAKEVKETQKRMNAGIAKLLRELEVKS